MHLLVLSAFRLNASPEDTPFLSGLNAPFGAQCFPTKRAIPFAGSFESSQCTFWCSVLSDWRGVPIYEQADSVSMHLLVLSAFRLGQGVYALLEPYFVSMHLLVLSAFRRAMVPHARTRVRSQCTFWCSVLSDKKVVRVNGKKSLGLNAPFGAQCFPTLDMSARETPQR